MNNNPERVIYDGSDFKRELLNVPAEMQHEANTGA